MGLQVDVLPKFKLLPLEYTLLDQQTLKPTTDAPSGSYSQAKAQKAAGVQEVVFGADYELVA